MGPAGLMIVQAAEQAVTVVAGSIVSSGAVSTEWGGGFATGLSIFFPCSDQLLVFCFPAYGHGDHIVHCEAGIPLYRSE